MKQRRLPLPLTLFILVAALLHSIQAQGPPGPGRPVPRPNNPPVNNPPANNPAAYEPAFVTNYPPTSPERVEAAAGDDGQLYSFKFVGADLDTVLETYCLWTDKTYFKTEALNASITLKASDLTKKESIEIIEAILSLNNIALIPMGDKFLKVVQATAPDIVGQGVEVHLDPEHIHGISEQLVTQIIPLKNVEIPEVQNAVQHLMHAYGKIQTLQRSNSLMITDTETTINRIRELIEFIDQASAGIEPRIYEIQYAEATEIAAKLTEIISIAQEDEKPSTPTSTPTTRIPPGVIRARGATASQPTRATISETESGANVIIRGNVKVMADERTNIIFIFSQKENFDFFDKIIKVLDVEVDPAITFEVVNLEYADAEELAGTLNELVGAATGTRTTGSGTSSTARRTSSGSSSSRSSLGIQRAAPSSSSSSRAVVTPNASPEDASSESAASDNASPGNASVQNLNALSENTKILADVRSNSILLMGEKADIAALKKVVKSLDVMLEQVVIEAAIFEIGLGDDLRHGINWLYRAMGDEKVAAWDGSSVITNTIQNIVGGALSYYQAFPDLDSQMLINLSLTDTDSDLISTPVIMTTDTTEATLSIGEQRPVVTSTDTYASNLGGQRSNYEYKDIGIQLTVTPRINPQRFVVMEINQKADQIGTIVKIDNNDVPTILNREFEASIAVPDGGTVVLGGLVSKDMQDTLNKIPILGDIPLIGRYLFSSVTKTEQKRELLVLMTPYVMTNLDEMSDQTTRLYKGTSLRQENWNGNWSQSPLRNLPDPEEEEASTQDQ